MEDADRLVQVPLVPMRTGLKNITAGRNRTSSTELKLASEAADERQLRANPSSLRNVSTCTRQVTLNWCRSKTRPQDSLLRLANCMSSDSFEFLDISSVPNSVFYREILQESKQKPDHELQIDEVGAAANQYITGSGDAESIAVGTLDFQNPQHVQGNKTPTTSTSKQVWNKLAKKLKGKPLTSASITKSVVGLPSMSNEEGCHIGWMRSLHNFFRHSKKHSHPKSSQMSIFGLRYQLLPNGELPTPSPVCILASALDTGLGMALRETNDTGQKYAHQHTRDHDAGQGKRSREFVKDVPSRQANDSYLQLSELNAGADWDDSTNTETPLLEHPVFQKLGECERKSHQSANASLDQLAGGPSAAQPVLNPWILRKYKLRDSPKWLKIDPAKELLFHLIGDAEKKLYACSIKLENRTQKYVAFKFKSTSPDRYQMKPKHGILAPDTRIEVQGHKLDKPLISSRSGSSSSSKNDMFVIVTLPLPASMTKEKTFTVSSSIFDRYKAKCCCEGVLYVVLSSHSTDRNETKLNVGGEPKLDALLNNVRLGLSSIPEDCNHED